MSDFEGRCLCGAVKFSITPPTIFFGHCHCHYCQEAHGAAFVSWVGAAEERFRYTAGSREPRWYQSSEQSRRGFCDVCGTTLFFASTLCPGEIHVTRTSIQGPIDVEPQSHVFFDQHAAWVQLGDELPRYTSDEPGLKKFKSIRRKET